MQISQIPALENEQSSELKKQRGRAAKALANARQRCCNPKNKDYANYGAMGIKVLLDVDELIDAIGYPSPGATLDRKNPHGHYEASNLRWATKAVQAANKKTSKLGGTLSLSALAAQQKSLIATEAGRVAVSDAWKTMIAAWNRGYLPGPQAEALLSNIKATGALASNFDLDQVFDHQEDWGVFHLPALSLPGARVRARGGPFEPEQQGSPAYRGIIPGLANVELYENLPVPARKAFRALQKNETESGQTWVGQPSEQRLLSGWFDIWMLVAASSLARQTSTAFRPVHQLLDELPQVGSPARWDVESHILLDTRILFVPDFQLDCGAWGDLKPQEWTTLERLLQYRMKNGHVTVVGVQNPHKLRPALQRILFGHFDYLEGFETAEMIQPAKPMKFTPTYRALPPNGLSVRHLVDDPRGARLLKA